MQDKNQSGTATAVQRRGGFDLQKIGKEVGLRIGFVLFCWFLFQWAAHS